MTRVRYICMACGIGAIAILLVAFGLLFARSRPAPANPRGFSFVGAPLRTGSFISFGFSNSSDFELSYIACPPQIKSNGVWLEVQIPVGPTSTNLLPSQPGTLLVQPPLQPGTWRVPVLWCYQPTTIDALKGRVKNFAAHVLGTKADGFRIQGYTNYSDEVLQ